MIHDPFDLEHWKAIFPLAGMRADAQAQAIARFGEQNDRVRDEEAVAEEAVRSEPVPAIGSITSPYHLVVVEQVREEAMSILESSKRIMTDIFTFALGEPERRDVTKTGGLPYWPTDRSWPWSDDEPAVFLAQLSFVDSIDLLPDLPGEVLLVFAHRAWLNPEEWDDWQPDLVFAWQSLGDRQLVEADDVPAAGSAVLPCSGAVYRTCDLPDGVGDLNRVPRWKNGAVLNGTKIGGVPVNGRSEYMGNARFLGSIGSIDPVFGRPWPFLNVEQPMATIRQSMEWHSRLTWGDLGRLDLYFDGERVLYRVEDS